MSHWANELSSEKPAPFTSGAMTFAGPEDVDCLPALARAIHAIGQRCKDGDTSAAAYGYVVVTVIDKIIDGETVRDVPEDVFWAVRTVSCQFPAEAGERAKTLDSRLGAMRDRKQINQLLERLETGETGNRKGIIADIEGILRGNPELRQEFQIPPV